MDLSSIGKAKELMNVEHILIVSWREQYQEKQGHRIFQEVDCRTIENVTERSITE